jgi:hypothetical protein
VAKNYYFERDFRRNYPKTKVYTREDVNHLLGAPQQLKYVLFLLNSRHTLTSPERLEGGQTSSSVAAAAPVGQLYSATKLPPPPVGTFKKHKYVAATDSVAPEEPGLYYPIRFLS